MDAPEVEILNEMAEEYLEHVEDERRNRPRTIRELIGDEATIAAQQSTGVDGEHLLAAMQEQEVWELADVLYERSMGDHSDHEMMAAALCLDSYMMDRIEGGW